MKNFKILTAVAVMAVSAFGCSETAKKDIENKPQYIAENGLVTNEVMQPFTDYFDGMINNDADKMLLATTPAVFIEEMMQSGKYETLLSETRDVLIPAVMETWTEKYGTDPSAELLDVVSNTPFTDEQLDFAELCYKYNYFDVKKDLEITDGFEVTYKYKIQGADSSTEGEDTACFVRVENDGWKMISVPAEALEEYRGAEDPYQAESTT